MNANWIQRPCRQYHQHFTSNFFDDILLPKNYKAKPIKKKSCAKHIHAKKAARKMLGKFAPCFLKALIHVEVCTCGLEMQHKFNPQCTIELVIIEAHKYINKDFVSQ